jgi:hypothetical protein
MLSKVKIEVKMPVNRLAGSFIFKKIIHTAPVTSNLPYVYLQTK